MIVKPYNQSTTHQDRRQRAGADAESQMAHYLHRGFKDDPDVYVLHGLRIEDPGQPEQDGSTGVCQIDHLIVHRWGMFIVESKSVKEEVQVRPDGSGGDEWSRVYGNKKTGIPSPIQQARRQSEFLRAFLQRHRKELVGRMPIGLRTISKAVNGTDQRGFMRAPMQLVIAVSDGGRITRLGGWEEPRKPFRVFVAKADSVPDKIAQELKQHRAGARLLTLNPMEEYGLWNMEAGEAETVAGFLAARHAERSSVLRAHSRQAPVNRSQNHSKPDPARPESVGDVVCKHCGATDLTARWGKFGYYWRCRACGKNTKVPVECSACGAQRQRDNQIVRIRKEGTRYFRECEACETSELVWIEAWI